MKKKYTIMALTILLGSIAIVTAVLLGRPQQTKSR